MTPTFREADHPRNGSGEFATKINTDPAGQLAVPTTPATSMKTPEQIADDAMGAFTPLDEPDEASPFGYDVEEQSADFIRDQIIGAIESDRAQRVSEPATATWEERRDAYWRMQEAFRLDGIGRIASKIPAGSVAQFSMNDADPPRLSFDFILDEDREIDEDLTEQLRDELDQIAADLEINDSYDAGNLIPSGDEDNTWVIISSQSQEQTA